MVWSGGVLFEGNLLTVIQALDDEAEALVKKLWRMVIYYSETEKRGIK